MPAYAWKTFLSQWSQDVLSTDIKMAFPPEVRSAGWIGYSAATEAEIARAETRLNTTLPPSYREFLQITNGWPMVTPLLGRLWSSKRTEWLSARRSSLVEGWLMGEALSGPLEPIPDEAYFVYGEKQDSALMRGEYLRSALEISDLDIRDDAIYLLNPQVVTPQGEWEAWYLASWLPGAIRYPSFWKMMQAEYERFLDSIDELKNCTQDFLDYVEKRLQPEDAPKALTIQIEDLRAALQDAVNRASVEPKPGDTRTLPQYQQGVVEGLQLALERVREIEESTQDPQELEVQLRALADDLNGLGLKGIQSMMKEMNAGKILLAGLMDKLTGGVKGLDRQFQSAAKPAGYTAAASIIRSFLDR
ncbi:MAG: SMI1/KNR4 family protein [Anaerolineales bacterium]|jgi:hypothetical protein